jgi:iron complex outermembrane receptor protein
MPVARSLAVAQGLLGSRDFMETPFSMTTYTSQAVKNQQARTLAT